MKSTEHTLALSGHTVHYWEYNKSKKNAIVMIHGFRGTHHGLERIVENLSEFHIIVPDLPGFGASEPFTDDQHSASRYVKFVHEFVEKLHLKTQPDLLGHSFGSIVAAQYAAQYASTINKLILVNPIGAPALEGGSAALTQLAIGYYWLGKVLPARAAKRWLSTPLIVKIMSVTMAKSKDKDMQRFVHQQHLEHFSTFANATVVAEAFRASVENDVSHVADKITVPTLLIVGEQDDITPIKKQHVLHKKMPSSSLHSISGVGHLIHYETPTEAAEAVRAFLSK